MMQATFREAVTATPEMRTAMRYYVCPVATLTVGTLNKLLKECNPSHLMVDVDVLDKEHKRLFYRRSDKRTLLKDDGECVPVKAAPSYMKDGV
jgi:hypothetical protein